ncbi:MAG: hypothetical protein LBP63_04655 [Prevotellaceae bacterium]|jgi:hypothetical protein|nr:hypothetical protein [Prevotellaceae bacterium]
MKKNLKITMYVLIALCISVMYSCEQPKTVSLDVAWDVYTLKFLSVQELPNAENAEAGKQVKIKLNYVSNSQNLQGLSLDKLAENYKDFELIDSIGNTFQPLSEVDYSVESIILDQLTARFVNYLSSFEFTYDIPENISIQNLSLKVNEQIINLDKIQKQLESEKLKVEKDN